MKNKIDYASYFFDRSVILFFIKVLIALIPFVLAYALINNYFKKSDQRGSFSEKVFVGYLKGLVSNPESFYQASLEYEKKNRYAKAIVEMQYAIALLEGPAHNPKMLECYRRRLVYLQQERLFYEGF